MNLQCLGFRAEGLGFRVFKSPRPFNLSAWKADLLIRMIHEGCMHAGLPDVKSYLRLWGSGLMSFRAFRVSWVLGAYWVYSIGPSIGFRASPPQTVSYTHYTLALHIQPQRISPQLQDLRPPSKDQTVEPATGNIEKTFIKDFGKHTSPS